MYTANTMATAIEALGMSLPYSSSTPAEDPGKLDECFKAGAAIRNLLELDLKPRDIMTRRAFENAMVLVMALGRIDQCRVAFAGDGACGGSAVGIGRFSAHERPCSVSGRSEAERPIPCRKICTASAARRP